MNRLAVKLGISRIRRWLRSSEATTIILAVGVGILAGLTTRLQELIAHGLQHLIYGVGINRLSALASIHHPIKLLALPLGGLLLALFNRRIRLSHAPVDVVEANALHGGRVPLRDSLMVSAQTLISNGFGASVGLEATYTQAGGWVASAIGRWIGLKRTEMRILVGAGAGAAIGSAFGAPLAGAFYGFEIVIGAYTPAAIAPVMAAALAARLVTRLLGGDAYLISGGAGGHIGTLDYLLYGGLGIVSAIVGIAIMRGQTLLEGLVSRSPLSGFWRPVAGGLLLIPIAWISPQALSAGHGALRLELALQPAMDFLVVVFLLKALASIVSLSFGFRGGLFFASLFLGSLLGPIYAQVIDMIAGQPVLDQHAAALVGMAALAVTIVGAPMTLSLLVLEATHDFSLTGVAVMAALCSSAFARAHFGYSFSTWRLHLRGTGIRSARDVSWMSALTAGRMMRRDPTVADAGISVGAFRDIVPLGSTSRVLLTEPGGIYRGIVATSAAYDPHLDPLTPIASLAHLTDTALAPSDTMAMILERFDALPVDDLAVVDGNGVVLGVLTEKYVHRRYAEEIEKVQARLFGE